jgi:hypothetical protein
VRDKDKTPGSADWRKTIIINKKLTALNELKKIGTVKNANQIDQ